MKILVSIVNWNDSAATNLCLKKIAGLPRSRQPDLVVTDNNSTKDPFYIESEIKKSLRSLTIIKNDRNLGFAAGHNINIKRGHEQGYDYIFLLNHDSQIIGEMLFEKMVEALEKNPQALAANPTILSSVDPERIWYAGGKLSLRTSAASHLNVGKTYSEAETEKVSFLTGACLAINLKRAELEQLLLNEDYFLYWEDADWCARAAKSGYELLYVPQAKLFHQVSSGLGVRSPTYIYYNIRNHFLFIRRNIAIAYWPFCWVQVLYITLKYKAVILFRYKKGKARALRAIWHGWVDGIHDIKGQASRL